MKRYIYLDNAAATAMDPAVIKAINHAWEDFYGNPSSTHVLGQAAKARLSLERKKTAEILNCKPREVIFTSGGTEANNLALQGFALKNRDKGKHIITTNIEHSSVLECLQWLEKNGFEISYLQVEQNGIIDPQKIARATRKDTILVSVMYANNEIGTIQPIKEIAAVCHNKQITFHTDACQAACSLDIDVKGLGIDMMTLNSGKIYGPKGMGLLYKRQGVEVEPLLHGGGQEWGLRAGTENLPLIIGFIEALHLAKKRKASDNKKILKLRDKIISTALARIEKVTLNGDPKTRLTNNINLTFEGIEAEVLTARLSMEGICVSAGSACASGSVKPSHVILALGIPYEKAHGTIRISLGRQNTDKEIGVFLKKLEEIVKDLRQYSPLF